MARPTVKPTKPPKQKRGRQTNNINKRAKMWAAFDFYRVFGWIWVTSKSDVFSRVARDCTWLSADCFSQNFYFSISLSLIHKASVFLLELFLSQEVFHQQPSLLQQSLVFLFSFLSSDWEVFHQRYDLLRLISFLTGLWCSHYPRFPSLVSFIGLGGFFTKYPSTDNSHAQ